MSQNVAYWISVAGLCVIGVLVMLAVSWPLLTARRTRRRRRVALRMAARYGAPRAVRSRPTPKRIVRHQLPHPDASDADTVVLPIRRRPPTEEGGDHPPPHR